MRRNSALGSGREPAAAWGRCAARCPPHITVHLFFAITSVHTASIASSSTTHTQLCAMGAGVMAASLCACIAAARAACSASAARRALPCLNERPPTVFCAEALRCTQQVGGIWPLRSAGCPLPALGAQAAPLERPPACRCVPPRVAAPAPHGRWHRASLGARRGTACMAACSSKQLDWTACTRQHAPRAGSRRPGGSLGLACVAHQAPILLHKFFNRFWASLATARCCSGQPVSRVGEQIACRACRRRRRAEQRPAACLQAAGPRVQAGGASAS